MAQKTDLNVAPYYDDFDVNDNFHRVLFRPGFAVQARELTQLQSILQNQIERHGQNVFRDGTTSSPPNCDASCIEVYAFDMDIWPGMITVPSSNTFCPCRSI